MQQQKTSHWLIAFRVIFTAALLACILFIFRNSMQTGEVSSARSQAVTTLVNGFLGKFGLGPLSEHIIRKLAHFSEFMLEGFLLMLCLRVYTRHFVRHISWPLLAGMSTALMDETIQISHPQPHLVCHRRVDRYGRCHRRAVCGPDYSLDFTRYYGVLSGET